MFTVASELNTLAVVYMHTLQCTTHWKDLLFSRNNINTMELNYDWLSEEGAENERSLAATVATLTW